jgi:L-asparaginase/Glu-tRNA(Gln) amidotransferase subunit D
MKIKVLMTGGTIDKVYNTSTGELTFVKTHIIEPCPSRAKAGFKKSPSG